MYQRVLITGGAGFVGTTLAIRLKQEFEGIDIFAFDNLRRRGSELNLVALAAAGVRFVHGDVRSLDDLESVPALPDLVIDCSAEPSVQAGYSSAPAYVVQTNLSGSYCCLELVRKAKADLLFLSTSRVYPFAALNELRYREDATRFALTADQPFPGASERGISEDFPLAGARSLYGMTKLASEMLVEEYAYAYGIRAAVTRFGVLAGPRQMAKSDQGVIALWAAAHRYGKPLSYIGFGGTGKQVRDVLHIDDFCDLLVDQIRHLDLYQGKPRNAGGGLANSLSLLETTRLCEEVFGTAIAMGSIVENRPADVAVYVTDNRAISAVNGWQPRRDPRRVVEDIRQWLEREDRNLRPILAG